jgi:hypothetical protein
VVLRILLVCILSRHCGIWLGSTFLKCMISAADSMGLAIYCNINVAIYWPFLPTLGDWWWWWWLCRNSLSEWVAREAGAFGTNLPQCASVHHRSYITWTGFDPGSKVWETGAWTPAQTKSIDSFTGFRTRYLQACSIVPQTTMLPLPPSSTLMREIY